MNSRLVRIFCANSPSQKAKGASYNLLLLLRKDCLFCHQSEFYGPPSPSISLESIKSLYLFIIRLPCLICWVCDTLEMVHGIYRDSSVTPNLNCQKLVTGSWWLETCTLPFQAAPDRLSRIDMPPAVEP